VSKEHSELERILSELKQLLDEVLRVMSGARDEQLLGTCLVAISVSVDDPAVVDDLLAAIDDGALNVLQALDPFESDPRLGPFSLDRVASRQDSTAVREQGSVMSIADELLLENLVGTGSSDLLACTRSMAIEPRETDQTAEGQGFDSPIEATRVHRHFACRGRRRRTGWTRLTDAERRVAELVSLGLTKREVGEQMCLSRQAVDAHLRHVLAKLGISPRVQLERNAHFWSKRSGT
jgi:DNA-binding CsgD family transcriptional regulator